MAIKIHVCSVLIRRIWNENGDRRWECLSFQNLPPKCCLFIEYKEKLLENWITQWLDTDWLFYRMFKGNYCGLILMSARLPSDSVSNHCCKSSGVGGKTQSMHKYWNRWHEIFDYERPKYFCKSHFSHGSLIRLSRLGLKQHKLININTWRSTIKEKRVTYYDSNMKNCWNTSILWWNGIFFI